MGGRNGKSVGSKAKKIDTAIANTKVEIAKRGYPDSYIYKDPEVFKSGKSIDELKKDAGQPILTSEIYGNEPTIMPQQVMWHIGDLGKTGIAEVESKTKIQRIKISEINVAQRFVFEKPLKAKMSNKSNAITIYKYNGKYYINDGNHRLAAEYLKGKKYIDSKVIIVN